MKLDFYKIELQKRDIFLISLGTGAEGYIICVKRAFAYFAPNLDNARKKIDNQCENSITYPTIQSQRTKYNNLKILSYHLEVYKLTK